MVNVTAHLKSAKSLRMRTKLRPRIEICRKYPSRRCDVNLSEKYNVSDLCRIGLARKRLPPK